MPRRPAGPRRPTRHTLKCGHAVEALYVCTCDEPEKSVCLRCFPSAHEGCRATSGWTPPEKLLDDEGTAALRLRARWRVLDP